MQYDQARVLLKQDKNFSKGFKFDHVWPILKDIEKFTDNTNIPPPSYKRQSDSSQSENPDPSSPILASPGLSSFNINLTDDDVGGASSQRPIGVKKAKLKKKLDEGLGTVVKTIKKGNEKLVEALNKGESRLDQNYELQMRKVQNEEKKLALKEFKEENRILYMNLDAITDPNLREFTRTEQIRIMQKRAQQQQNQGSAYGSGDLSQFFNNLGGSGSNLPDY